MKVHVQLDCPVCEQKIQQAVDLIETWQEFKILRCPFCDVYFSDPLTPPGDLVNMEPYIELDWNHQQFLNAPPVSSGKLLDLGCGSGYFLSLAQKLGFDCYGVDVNKSSIDMARERFGLKHAYCCQLKDLPQKMQADGLSLDGFDVITMIESVEHLDCPAKTLRHVNSLLKPGGFLALSTPNRNRLMSPFRKITDYPPNHQTRWDHLVLKKFLERCGFDEVNVRIKKIDRHELSRPVLDEKGFKIASRILQSGAASQNPALIKIAGCLSKVKTLAVKTVFSSVVPFLRLVGAQGWDLYAVARKKKEK